MTGFVRVPKTHPKYSQRWYYNPDTGQEITRRAYQTLSKGGIRPEEISKIRRAQGIKKKTGRYQGFVRAYKENTARKLGIKPSKVKVRGNSKEAVEFKQKYAKLKKITKSGKFDRSKDGEAAKLLIELNMRNPEFQGIVGES